VRDVFAGDSRAPTTIPLAVNSDSLATWVLPALAGVRSGVTFDLHREDQDHSAGLLRSGAVMAAITTDSRLVQGCSVTRLGTMRYRPMASPSFTERWFPGGATTDALSVAPVVVFDRKDALQERYLRAVRGPGLRLLATTCRGRRISPPPCVSAWAGACCPTSSGTSTARAARLLRPTTPS
jgi:LysR family transcriptional regulator (chromosome initiation inhibitor)